VDYYLNSSIQKQFTAFAQGFKAVLAGDPLELFRAEELELLICGEKTELNLQDLEKGCKYVGWTATSIPVRYFWSIVHKFTSEQKRKLLAFTTGTDRVPLGGLAKLSFIIQKNGGDTDKLPTAYTCYNVLLLPEYSTQEKMEKLLLTAINNYEGFGMR